MAPPFPPYPTSVHKNCNYLSVGSHNNELDIPFPVYQELLRPAAVSPLRITGEEMSRGRGQGIVVTAERVVRLEAGRSSA